MDISSQSVLLFDLGGVLVDASGIDTLSRWLPNIPPREIRRRWHASEAVKRFECGKTTRADFATQFLSEWSLALDPEAFIAEFSRWVSGFYPGAIDLLSRLKRHHPIACLSNTNVVHWEILAQDVHIFDHCFPSHWTGHMKPDVLAYENVVRQLGVDAQDIVFLDDLENNVEAARRVGMQSFLTLGLKDVEAALALISRELAGCSPPASLGCSSV